MHEITKTTLKARIYNLKEGLADLEQEIEGQEAQLRTAVSDRENIVARIAEIEEDLANG